MLHILVPSKAMLGTAIHFSSFLVPIGRFRLPSFRAGVPNRQNIVTTGRAFPAVHFWIYAVGPLQHNNSLVPTPVTSRRFGRFGSGAAHFNRYVSALRSTSWQQ